MNPFQKNPFVNNEKTTIKGYNSEFNEKNKLEKIKMDMTKIKYNRTIEEQKQEKKQISIQEKLDILKNINK